MSEVISFEEYSGPRRETKRFPLDRAIPVLDQLFIVQSISMQNAGVHVDIKLDGVTIATYTPGTILKDIEKIINSMIAVKNLGERIAQIAVKRPRASNSQLQLVDKLKKD